MILRALISLVLFAILVFLYLVVNLYGVVAFLFWNHHVFQTLWHGKVPTSYDNGWGLYAFQKDFFEIVEIPWSH